MNKPKLKINEKGITLVALVITIIVLLILAGVAINMAINSDGLFGKANEAAESWNTAVEEESTAIQDLLDELEIDPPGVVSTQGVSLDKTSANVVIGKTAQLTATVTPSEATNKNVTWSSSDETKVTVDENGVVTGISEGTATITVTTESKNKTATCSITVIKPVTSYVTEGTRKAPIPVGFVASQIPTEDTISEGLVIYQGTDPVTGEANSTVHTTAMTTRNQFVWIPVDDIDYMVMCKSNASGSVCDLELVDGVLQCTNSAHTSTATDLCGRVYATTGSNTTVDSKYIYTYSQTFDEAQWGEQTWSTTSYREPDIVTGSAGTSYDGVDSNLTGIGFTATDDLTVQQVFLNQLTSDFTAMATSVAKYGGFYVSRYEAGENGASLKNQKVLVTGARGVTGYDTNTFINGNKWYGMYNTLRTSSAIDKTAVSSHMIWGSQTDMMIKFLGENSLNEPQVAHTARQLATQELTGETSTDIMSNIYDLEGNNYEWTAQAESVKYRSSRGGGFNYVANLSRLYPASGRFTYSPTDTGCYYGSRTTLYM